jgi:hypothetical protein
MNNPQDPWPYEKPVPPNSALSAAAPANAQQTPGSASQQGGGGPGIGGESEIATADATRNTAGSPPKVRPPTRKGKIARLPKAVRDRLNEMLLDGVTYAEAIQALGEDGKDLTEDNISNWRKGGYQDWLEEQKDRDDLHLQEEYTLQLVKENDNTTLNEAAIKMATGHIRKTLRKFGEATLQTSLEENSGNYIRLLNVLARLTTSAIACRRDRLKDDERNASTTPGQTDASNAITPETLAKIEEALRIR